MTTEKKILFENLNASKVLLENRMTLLDYQLQSLRTINRIIEESEGDIFYDDINEITYQLEKLTNYFKSLSYLSGVVEYSKDRLKDIEKRGF